MKKILNRKTGNNLSANEALILCSRVKRETGAIYVEHVSSHGYSTPKLTEPTLSKIIAAHAGYTFAFTGSLRRSDGYRAYMLGIKDLPVNFEQLFPDYVVIG